MRGFTGGKGLPDDSVVVLSSDSNAGIFKWDSDSAISDDGVDVIMPAGWVGNGRFSRLFIQFTRTYGSESLDLSLATYEEMGFVEGGSAVLNLMAATYVSLDFIEFGSATLDLSTATYEET